jgi:hypothetical protein
MTLLLKWNICWRLKVKNTNKIDLSIIVQSIDMCFNIHRIKEYFAFSYKMKYPNYIKIE